MKSLVLVSMLAPLAVSAATISVNSRADNTVAGDGLCTLREAVANVNAAADTTGGDCVAGTGAGDTITFTLALPARIKLTLGQLVIEQTVSIVGPTTGSLRISGARASRVFRITAGTTSASDLTIENGKSDFGGGIFNEGTLALTNCVLKSNKSSSGGGALANRGTATLVDCTLKGNSGRSGGGGISNGAGTLTVTNCTFQGNKGRVQGGGALANYATAAVTNCTLYGNTMRYGAGGGILNLGTLALTNCTLQRNKTFAGVGGLGGGGIWHYSGGGGSVTLINTIVAKSGAGRDCGGDPITSAGHNLDTDGTCFTTGGTDLPNTDPKLARLANYGGPTKTLALCSAAGVPRHACTGPSPAIDTGDDAVTGPPDNLATDQRGLPRLAGAHVDIGAYEAQ